MKAIVGSSDLWPTPAIASTVLSIMVSTDDVFGIRATHGRSPSTGVEELVAKIGSRVGRGVFFYAPDLKGNFERDIRLVKDADRVYAFFAPGQFMQGGTGHVVSCALRAGKPVEAYELDAHGNVIETATDEGEQA